MKPTLLLPLHAHRDEAGITLRYAQHLGRLYNQIIVSNYATYHLRVMVHVRLILAFDMLRAVEVWVPRSPVRCVCVRVCPYVDYHWFSLSFVLSVSNGSFRFCWLGEAALISSWNCLWVDNICEAIPKYFDSGNDAANRVGILPNDFLLSFTVISLWALECCLNSYERVVILSTCHYPVGKQ